MDCFGTYFTHAQTCDNVRVPPATQWSASVHTLHIAQTCDNVRVPPATQWTASVHTHAQKMPKPVITFVFKMPFFKKAKWFFSRNLCVFTTIKAVLDNNKAFCERKDNNKDSTGMIHDKLMVFTIHLLHAREQLKHCCQWMKIHFFARL